MSWFSKKPVVPVLRLSGPIGMATPLKPGLSIATLAGAIERAFALSKTPSVAIAINSPGGSPVQSHLIFRRIRQLAAEKKKKVYVFCEDVAASGGYFLAVAGDEIYADPSSIVGSIGVISSSFGLEKAAERLGIERRIHTSGTEKSFLDPFLPERPQDVARLLSIQREVHDAFIGVVKERRGPKLKAADADIFSGAFWTGPKAQELGLVDGIDDLRSRMRAIHGDKVRLKLVQVGGGGLLSKLLKPAQSRLGLDGGVGLADEVVTALEARSMWSRYGL